jgi:hypothetical protein
LLSHQNKKRKKKKRVWRQVCEWLSVAVACLPTAVSLLLLQALFMQISGVSLALTWPLRLCLLKVLLGTTATTTSFPLSKHTGGGDTAPASLADLFIYSCLRGCPSPPFGTQDAPPSFLCVFLIVVYYLVFFSLFSLGGGRSVQGAMLIWPRVVCWSTTSRLAHLVVCFSQAG